MFGGNLAGSGNGARQLSGGTAASCQVVLTAWHGAQSMEREREAAAAGSGPLEGPPMAATGPEQPRNRRWLLRVRSSDRAMCGVLRCSR
jgi:hypothetical protein